VDSLFDKYKSELDAMKHMNATKAKEKEADAKVVKPKSSGSKKFKTESTHRSKQEQKQH